MSDRKESLLADGRYDKSTIRKLLKCWRRYVEHKILSRKMMYKGNYFYTMRLKEKVFNGLTRHVRRCDNRNHAIEKLKLFHERLLIQNAWNKWSESIEGKNYGEFRDKLSLARSFYKKNISIKCLRCLMFNKILKKEMKLSMIELIDTCEEYYLKKFLTRWRTTYGDRLRDLLSEEKALKFYDRSLMRKSVSKWIEYRDFTISVKGKYAKSILHYEYKMIGKYFATWIYFCNERIREENLIIEATEYHLETLKRKIFNKLSMNILRRRLKQQKIETADNYRETNLTIKVFRNWRKFTSNSKESNEKLSKYNKNRENKLKLRSIREWRLYVDGKKLFLKMKSISVKHYRIKTLKRMFDRLRNYSIYKREKYRRLNYLNDRMERIKLNVEIIYYNKWRSAGSNLFKEKCKLFYADRFCVSNLNKKYFNFWKTYLIEHKMKRRYKKRINDMANDLIFKRCLNIWYTTYKASLEKYLNEMWASKIYEMKIKHKYFIAWNYLTESLKRDKKLINNSRESREKLVIKKGLQHLIKLFISDKESDREKQWSKKNLTNELKLLRKYLKIWRENICSMNNKDRLKTMKIVGNNNENGKSEKFIFIDDDKNLRDTIPRLMIPEFMKDQIKLHRGVRCCRSNKIPTNLKRMKILNNSSSQRSIINNEERIYSTDQSIQHQLNINNESKYDDKSSIDNSIVSDNDNDKKREKIGCKISKENKNNSITISPLLSPDSIKSDLDSCKTYTVNNPSYVRGSSGTDSLNDQLFEEKKTIRHSK